MKLAQSPISFRQVLPSALGILILGLGLSLLRPFEHSVESFAWLVIPYGVVFGAALYLLGYCVSCSPWTKTKAIHGLLMTLNQLFRNFSWTHIIIVSILAGVGEELLIRGVLQSFLVDSVGAFWGVTVASLVFGLLHFMTKAYVLLTFGLGLLFGLAFHYSGNIILVMIDHTVYDIIAFAMIVKYPHLLGLKPIDTTIVTTDQL